LFKLRERIETDQVIETAQPYQFLNKWAPTTLKQEMKKTIRECVVMVDGDPTIFLRKTQLFSGNTGGTL
jgi:hypothetical protein